MAALYAAYAAAPKVVPVVIAAVVFIVLVGIFVGIGTSKKLPGWMTFLFIMASLGLAGYVHNGVKRRMSEGVSHPASWTAPPVSHVTRHLEPEGGVRNVPGALSPVKMPASIMP